MSSSISIISSPDIGSIFTYVVLGTFFLVSLFFYVFLTACLLPRLLLIPQFNNQHIQDRGLKKYLFEAGRAMVCEPGPAVRPYIHQYILSDNNGERFLKCQLNPQICSIRYRVLTFDANDRPLQALDVEDLVATPGISRSVPLPLNTAYVSISLTDVNGKLFNDPVLHYSLFKILAYVISTVVFTLVEAALINYALRFLADLIFGYSDVVSQHSGPFLLALAAGVAYACLVFFSHYIKGCKISK